MGRLLSLAMILVGVTACGDAVLSSGEELPPNGEGGSTAQSVPTDLKAGHYFGVVAYGPHHNTDRIIFGHPLLVDGRGRALILAGDSSEGGFILDVRYAPANGSLSATVVLRRYPTGEFWSGFAPAGTYVNDRFDLDEFEVTDASGQESAVIGLDQAYGSAASEGAVSLSSLFGHYVATGDTDTSGAFDQSRNRFELDIFPDNTLGVGTCWRGSMEVLPMVNLVSIGSGTPRCETDDRFSGMLAVADDTLYLTLVEDGGSRLYYGTFPRH